MTGMYECKGEVCKMPSPQEVKRPNITEMNHEMVKMLMELNEVLVVLNNTVVSNSAVMPEVAEPMSLSDAVQCNLILVKEALDGAMKLKSAI